MSGICGVWAFDGGAPDLDPLLAKLERRGPDGTHRWCDGPVALGHTLLATTPEALVEVLPLTEPDSGCTITADARLDNREELIAALDLTSEVRVIGDGELILRAYLKWGEDCPKQLLGDFAFAIWDSREQRLFCARDHMGMRQLIYHHAPGRLFGFATEADAILTHRGVPRLLNRGRVADFLIDLEGLDLVSTFYKDIQRLPPAHLLIVSGEQCVVRSYWTLRPGPPLLLDPTDYATAFLEVFTEAVSCRLRRTGRVGAMLSGGLDSSSVAAIAADLLAKADRGPLPTFSVLGPTRDDCPETQGIRAAAEIVGITPTFVDYSDLGPMNDELGRRLKEIDEPFDGHMNLVRAVYLAAHAQGLKIVLDGVAGDVALTAGNRVASLLREGRPVAAWREVSGEASFWKTPSHRPLQLLAAAWVAFAPMFVRRSKRRMARAIADARVYSSRVVRRDFARQIRLRDRLRKFRTHGSERDLPDVEQRIQFILHPHLTVGRERYDRVAAAFGIEPRDPFTDIRLIEFCLSVPAEQVQAGGWPKMLLRRAMKGKMPDRVIWRRGKESLGWVFSRALFANLGDWRSMLGSSHRRLAEYSAPATVSRLAVDAKPRDDRTSFDLYYLACWLSRFDRNT